MDISLNISVQVKKSIGDDIDDLYDHFKMNDITLTDRISFTDWFPLVSTHSIMHCELTVKTFHLSMLSDQEEREITREMFRNFEEYNIYFNNLSFDEYLRRNPSVGFGNFKNETTLSKKETNYVLSLCARKTFFYTYDMGDMNAYLLEY